MRILLIYPVPRYKIVQGVITWFHQGIGQISSVLKEAGYQTALLSVDILTTHKILPKIRSFRPDIIGISSTSLQMNLTRQIVSTICSEFKLPIIIGGIHPTIAPEDSINIPGILGICRGEGEYPLLDLVKALDRGDDYTGIRNFWFRELDSISGRSKYVIKNELRPLIQELDHLPFPDREIFDYQRSLDITHRFEFFLNRGCPYQCTYCVNKSLAGIYKAKGHYVRYRSVQSAIEEIERAIQAYGNFNVI